MAYVLVVDDDPDSVEMVCNMLGRRGHETECVPNGRDALEAILKRSPDLVVLDLLMPEMDGPDLLQVLRAYLRFQTLPVLVYTAQAEGPIVDRAKRLGIVGLMTKTRSTPNDVADKVERQLSQLC